MPALSAVSRRNRTVFTSILLMLLIKKRKQVREQRQPRRWWIRPVFLARKQEGLYHTAMKRMREGDHEFFFKFYRMTPALFDVLLRFVAQDLTKIHVSRETLEPGERLAITLSYLASGQDIPSVALAYRVGIETARLCIDETCEAIWERLKDHVMKVSGSQFHFDVGYLALRRCAENAFGITAARWRIQLRTIYVQPSHVDFVVKAACVLHNFLTLYNPHAHQFLDREDSFRNVVGGRWRHGVQHVPDNSFFAMAQTQARNYDADAGAARRLFASYFSSTAGQVPWQWNLPGLTKKQPS
ncbi:hypothetical protein HPB51_014886 [Rhipicephalus microplus]|uniref:DDE Tnp4 domain-containing protein n=1 Tax=Rhipicephalus microplus TaxID=6941 RepID=A0A9J6EH38_RHIMP|nr:hypothetical protein HPB51_014886 [Rhipicephalus microplus]